MKKINQALNDFKILGLSIGQIAIIVTILVGLSTLSSKITAGQDARIKVHNETAENVHPYIQDEINVLKMTDQKLADAIKAVEKANDSNTNLIIAEIRKLNNR